MTTAAPGIEPAPSATDVGVGLVVYAVVPAESHLPEGLRGLDGAAVTLLEWGRVAAVVGRISVERPAGRRQELLDYHRVVDAIASAGPVVPVQFGSVMADADAVRDDLLAPAEGDFVQALAELRGHAQYNLRAVHREEAALVDVVVSNPEVRALREQTRDQPEDAAWGQRVRLGEAVVRHLEQRSQDYADVLLDALSGYAAEVIVRAGPGARQVVDLALLVSHDRAEDFEARCEELAAEWRERVQLRLLGPLAPYDFVGDW